MSAGKIQIGGGPEEIDRRSWLRQAMLAGRTRPTLWAVESRHRTVLSPSKRPSKSYSVLNPVSPGGHAPAAPISNLHARSDIVAARGCHGGPS